MNKSRSPFKDNRKFQEEIKNFLNIYGLKFAQEIDRTSSYFELAVYNDIVRYYENNGYTVVPKNKSEKNFIYALSPSAKPDNCSYFLCSKKYKKKPNREFEIRHNIRIQSKHDERVFVSPDYAVIESGSILSTKVSYFYNKKSDYFYVNSDKVATFAENKNYKPSPELVLNFIGLVNEIMPCLLYKEKPEDIPKHFGPALFVSGVGNEHLSCIKNSLMERYGVNIFLGLFAYPSQLYSVRKQGFIKKIGSNKI